jgi:hypothetical protein
MSFKSKAQARYLFSQHPEIAKKWAKEGYKTKGLPEHKHKKESDLHKKAIKMLSKKGKK